MAAIYRLGFEGGYIPKGVSFSGSYMLVQGRSGVGSTAVCGIDPAQTAVFLNNRQCASELYTTHHLKLIAFGGGQDTTIIQFGPAKVTYSALDQSFRFWSNGTLLHTADYSFPSNVFVPISGHIKLGSSGIIEVGVEDTLMSYTGDTLQGSTNSIPDNLLVGLGSSNLVQSSFAVDDLAVNDPVQASNSSGSWGASNTSYPNYIRGLRNLVQSTGSVFQWFNGNSFATTSIIDIANGKDSSSYLQSSTYDKLAQFKPTPIISDSVVDFEGFNVFVDGATTIDSRTNVFFEAYLSNGGVTYNRSENDTVTSVPHTIANGAYEQDLGGRIDINSFNNGLINIVTRKFINQNFFGSGVSGSVVITGSVALIPVGDIALLDCNTLTIPSGSSLTVGSPCKALVIYVKDSFVLEGTVSMTDKGLSGSLSDSPIVLWKNISSSFDYTTASFASTSTWGWEQTNQPYSVVYSSDLGFGTFASPEVVGTVGGGGAGGSSSLALGGRGGSSSFYAGGLGGSGAAGTTSGLAAGDFATNGGSSVSDGPVTSGAGAQTSGGVVYIIVGKHFVLNGAIVSRGSNGLNASGVGSAGGGGGSGGGSVNILYGNSFFNLSNNIDVGGGLGGLASGGAENGHAGGSGSIRITKLLTN